MASLTLVFTSSAYEVYKTSLKTRYAKQIKDDIAKEKEGKECINKTVDMCLRDYTDEGCLDNALNLYNTTSETIVNGPNYNCFITVMDKIKMYISSQPLDILTNCICAHLDPAP